MSLVSDILAHSPLVYWRLGEASGTTAADASGNSRAGTYSGTYTLGQPSLVPTDLTDTSVDFSNGQVTIANAAWMNVSNMSVFARVRPDSVTGAHTIVGRNSAAGTNICFNLRTNGNKAEVLLSLAPSGSANTLTGVTVLSTGTEYTIAATYDGTTLKLFVNGVLDNSVSLPGAMAQYAQPIILGRVASSVLVWDGRIDEVAFIGTAISDSAMAALHSSAVDTATTVHGGQATETDAAQAGSTKVGAVVPGGQAQETDTAQAGSAVAGAVVSGGQGQETDSALPGSVIVADVVPGSQAQETDTAQGGSITAGAVVSGGQAQETDEALAGTVDDGDQTVVAGGQAAETDESFAGLVTGGSIGTNPDPSNGRNRGAIGVLTWEPPVEDPPGPVTAAGHGRPDYIAAYAFTGFSIAADGHPVLAGAQMKERVRPRTRILVDGKDVTFFRGFATPEPTYSLISPLLYGSGSIEFPQVHAAFEQLGVGELAWLRPFAPVVVQRLNEAGEVSGISYRGFLLDPNLGKGEGNLVTLTFGLAGEASGRAALIDQQPRIFRKRNDLTFWWKGLIRDLRLPFGASADTGIILQNTGGMSVMEYANYLSAQGVRRGGAQWTCMPNFAGEYKVARKDLTTIDATVYFDDARTVPNLRRDPAEEPNRVFATAVSPSGRRIRFADYPVLQKQKALPYPMMGGDPFGEGTTDGDTDTGGGVTAMISRLVWTGYLSHDERPGGYDEDVTEAVEELQEDAGLSVTGNMNPNTWDALFDTDVTGHSIAGAQIRPAAQQSRVRKYNRTGSGAIIGPNPDYDPKVIQVDRTFDAGVGFTQNQAKRMARQIKLQADSSNWVGTVTFNTGGLILGEHTPGDTFAASDVMDARRLKPGMNVWAPLFDGGTLFHVSGVTVNGRSISATLDTRARDTMEVWEIIKRNRESRKDPARQWLKSHRSSGLTNDVVSQWDDAGGEVEDTELHGGRWNVLPVVTGQEGTIASLRLRLSGAKCEFVVAVFGRDIPESRLEARIGNPLTEAGSAKWTDQDVLDDLDDNWLLLYVAGDDVQPCGYYPKAKADAGASLTGVWKDDAGFGYRTFDDYSVWLAIYPAENCTLQGGQVFRNQLEAGS